MKRSIDEIRNFERDNCKLCIAKVPHMGHELRDDFVMNAGSSHSGGKTEAMRDNAALHERDPDYIAQLENPTAIECPICGGLGPDDCGHGDQIANWGKPHSPMMRSSTISCSICGDPTMMLGTMMCDPCWELRNRLGDRRRVSAFGFAKVELQPSNGARVALIVNAIHVTTFACGSTAAKAIKEAFEGPPKP